MIDAARIVMVVFVSLFVLSVMDRLGLTDRLERENAKINQDYNVESTGE